MSNDKSLKKALHRTILKAMAKPDRKHAVDHIVDDLQDQNMLAQVPKNHIPVSRQGVLHKEMSVSEMHQQKQMNARAAVGMSPKPQGPKMPKAPQMPKQPAMGKAFAASLALDEQKENSPEPEKLSKGLGKLRKFMETVQRKKSPKQA